jgi:type VI secretion system protein ImpA
MPLQTSELLQPIPGDSPGGSDVRYEPIFDKIKQARIEEEDLPTGDWTRERKTADFVQVIKLSADVLTNQSKDLQVAAWLTEALLKREGIGGLKVGLDLLASLLSEFWDHLYPEIDDDDLDFRVAPLVWVAQYLENPIRLIPIDIEGHTIFDYRDSQAVGYEEDADTYEKKDARKAALSSGKISAEVFDAAYAATPKAWYKQLISDIDSSVSASKSLEAVSDEKFLDVSPRFEPLRTALNEVRQTAGQLLAKRLETDPDPIEETPVEEIVVGGDAQAAEGGGTLSATPRSRSDAEARVAAAARYLRSARRTDPAPYLLLRGFRWGELRIDGNRVDPKLLVAPPTELRSKLRMMLLDGRWAELLDAGEDVMASPYGRGWLDLQRYVLTACSNLGSDYDNVATAIRGALHALIADLPQLPTLMLMDDTPTANPETYRWLREVANASEAGEGSEATPTARTGGGRSPYDRAMERVRAGEPDRGIEMLIQMGNQERSARERFLRRSEAASLMVDSGREAVAMPILEQLVQDIDDHTLEAWESGETVARPLGLLYRCIRRLEGDSSTSQSLYLRICRLDPLQAIKLDGQPQE